MSSTACVSARRTSQKIGRKPPRCGLSWGTNLPKFQFVPLNVTNSGYLTPTTVWYVTWETRALLDNTRPHFWRPATAASANGGKHARKPFSFPSQAHPQNGEGSTLDFSREAWGRVSDELMPKLRNCRIYGSGAVFQELSDFPPKWVFRTVKISHSNTPKSCASIYRVWQRKASGRLVSFFRNDFDSFLFFSPPGVCLWSPTYFAWLPEQLARTYCGAALDRHSGLLYGEVHHLQGSESDFRHSMVFQNIYHIGDTKSAQELEVFLRMSRERLRSCCGIQCTDSLHSNGPRQRQKLFTAALKLLRFAIGIETVRCENEAERALHAALLPPPAWRRTRPGYFERYCVRSCAKDVLN